MDHVGTVFADVPADLHAVVERTCTQLFADNLGLLVPSRSAEDLPALAHADVLPGLVLRLEGEPQARGREIAVEAGGQLARVRISASLGRSGARLA